VHSESIIGGLLNQWGSGRLTPKNGESGGLDVAKAFYTELRRDGNFALFEGSAEVCNCIRAFGLSHAAGVLTGKVDSEG